MKWINVGGLVMGGRMRDERGKNVVNVLFLIDDDSEGRLLYL